MGKKTVSVVMCTYNGEKYLREQMDSILAQTYPIHEIIVCDDCSTDGTMNIKNTLQSFHSSKYTEIHEIKDAIKTFMIYSIKYLKK